jgi:hypothetical protein
MEFGTIGVKSLTERRSTIDKLKTISKRKPSGLEFDIDMETSDMTERAIDKIPNWIKDTNRFVNPMTIQDGVMRELKMTENSNMIFQKFSDNPAGRPVVK